MTNFRPLQAFLCLTDISHPWQETRMGYRCEYCNKYVHRRPGDDENETHD